MVGVSERTNDTSDRILTYSTEFAWHSICLQIIQRLIPSRYKTSNLSPKPVGWVFILDFTRSIQCVPINFSPFHEIHKRYIYCKRQKVHPAGKIIKSQTRERVATDSSTVFFFTLNKKKKKGKMAFSPIATCGIESFSSATVNRISQTI